MANIVKQLEKDNTEPQKKLETSLKQKFKELIVKNTKIQVKNVTIVIKDLKTTHSRISYCMFNV